MLIYNCKLRFFAWFSLALAASPTFFNGLLGISLKTWDGLKGAKNRR